MGKTRGFHAVNTPYGYPGTRMKRNARKGHFAGRECYSMRLPLRSEPKRTVWSGIGYTC